MISNTAMASTQGKTWNQYVACIKTIVSAPCERTPVCANGVSKIK